MSCRRARPPSRPAAALALALLAAVIAARAGAEDLATPGLHELALTVGNRSRTAQLYLSTRYAAGKPRPLLIVLHGGGGRGQGMRALTRQGFERLADRDDGVVAYPDAIEGSWNDGRAGMGDRAHREDIDDIGFIRSLIERLEEDLQADPARISLTGMSNGAIMSYRCARELPGMLAAIAPVCGYLPRGDAARPWPVPTPVLLICSDEDPLVPFAGGAVHLGAALRGEVESQAQTVAFLLAQDHAVGQADASELPDLDPDDGTRVQRTIHEAAPGGAALAVYVVKGGGHCWPGGLQYLPERTIGRTSRDLDACAAIWAFCAAQARR